MLNSQKREINQVYFPEGYTVRKNDKVMEFANMLGRKTPGKDGYHWENSEYLILEGVDEEMAEMGIAMGFFTKRTAKEMAGITGKTEEYCHEIMMKLAIYGTTFVNVIDGMDTFWHAESWIPGIMEMVVNNLDNVQKWPIVSYAMEGYGRERGPLSAGMFPPGIGLMRVIPIDKTVDATTVKKSYEDIVKYLEDNTVFSCSPCSCRTNREVMGEGCGHLKEDMCIQMGHAAEYYIRTGRAKEITRDEAKEIIKRAEENGLMHQIPNIDGSGITHAICNCCGCGCLSLRSGAMYKNVDMLRSNYVAEPKKDDCTACGQCVEHCPMNAVQLGQKLTSKGPVVDDITTTRTPRNNEWTRVDWNADYRTNRKVNVATGTAPCKSKCPAHIGVQGYIKLAANGKYKEALELIKTENPFPAVCGYVCNRRCEDACTRQSVDEAVAIDEIKKYIAIQDLDSSTRFIPTKRNDYSDKKIAIIGAGPAGLTCAYFLALDGYDITVFEREEKLGGMLTLGIPEFVLGKDIVDAEIEVLKELGVKFKTGVNIGKDITLDDLRKEGFLAFYLAIGAQGGRSLGLEGENAEGVASGVSFLRDVNLGNAPQISGKVVVIGGGNVAIDVARVAARIDGTKVGMYCIESKKDMPAMDEEIETAEGEGITITNGVKPKKILVTDGKVTGVEFVDVNDESKVTKVECAHVYLAIGQTIEWGGILNNTPVKLEDDERIIVDELTYQSAQPDIFAGGDAVTGTKYAIDAIAAGKQGAISIHRFVQPGHDLRIGRSVRDFSELDTTAAIISNYDNTPRQRAEGVMTAEQVQAEAKRCLDCGVSVVDEYMCVGCGMCITKCKFEAIKLKREYDGEGVEFLKIRKTITPHVIKRRIKVKVRKLLGRK